MNPRPGELYLINLGVVGKVRPALVVSREDPECPRAVSLFAPLTTQYRGSAYEIALGKLRFLDKESWANVQGLSNIGYENLLRRLGSVSALQLASVRDALRFILEL